ncbi:MAG TPA: hypothetical protein VI756_18315 [Blastocatellia bacterium]
MSKGKPKMLTASHVAAKLGAAESSVRLWARQGKFPGAIREETPVGSYWMIPATALIGFTMGRPGRPPKLSTVKSPERRGTRR